MAQPNVNRMKEMVRSRMNGFRSGLSKAEVLAKSEEIRRGLFHLQEFRCARTVCFYVAKGNEVQTEQPIRDSMRMGKRVLVPITDTVSGTLILSELRDYAELERGAFDVLEPRSECRRIVSSIEADLVSVPGVAFDLHGHRLGYGGGYYDRLLKEILSQGCGASFIGLAYDFQVLDNIPHSSNDVAVHKIVTEKRVVYLNPRDSSNS